MVLVPETSWNLKIRNFGRQCTMRVVSISLDIHARTDNTEALFGAEIVSGVGFEEELRMPTAEDRRHLSEIAPA